MSKIGYAAQVEEGKKTDFLFFVTFRTRAF